MQQFYTVTFATILKNKIIKYTIDESESKLNEIIRDEIKRNTLDKKYNLSGEDSIFGGYDIYKHIPFGYSVPLKTPLIKLNLKFVSSVRGNIKKGTKITSKDMDALFYLFVYDLAMCAFDSRQFRKQIGIKKGFFG